MEEKGPSYEKYVEALMAYVRESNRIIEELGSIIKFVEWSHNGANNLKTAGVVSGSCATIATLGLLFAPITGGLSVVASGVAMCGAAGGLACGVITSWGEGRDGKDAKNRIEKCQRDHEKSVNTLKEASEGILSVINQLVGRGINIDAAIISTFAFLCRVGNSGKDFLNTLTTVAKIEKALQVGHIQKLLAPTGISITKTLSGGLKVSLPTVESLAGMTGAQSQAYIKLASTSHGPEVLLRKSLTTLGKVAVGVSVIFNLVDIALLIKSWNSDHPLVDPINDYISQLKTSIENVENQLNALKIFRR